MNTDDVPIMDITFFKDVNFTIGIDFLQVVASVSSPLILTGSVVELTLRGILGLDAVWLSSSVPDSKGSRIAITNALTGSVDVLLTAGTLRGIKNRIGSWYIKRIIDANNEEMLVRGTAEVLTIGEQI